MIRRPRMPKTVRLPFGYVVTVRYLTQAQMSRQGMGDSHGCWVGDERAIYVLAEDPPGEQAETLAHELQHAATDLRHYVDQMIRQPLRTEGALTQAALEEDDE